MTESLESELSMIEKIFNPLESTLGFLGLKTPTRRLVFFTALGSVVEYFIRPSYAYDENGNFKPIIYLTGRAGATYTPAGFIPLIFGILTSLYL